MSDRTWNTLMGLSLAGVASVGIAQVHGVLPTIVVLWFLLWAPGAAVVRLFLPTRAPEELVLAPALSIAVVLLLALGLVHLGVWAPRSLLGALFLACAAVWARELARDPAGAEARR